MSNVLTPQERELLIQKGLNISPRSSQPEVYQGQQGLPNIPFEYLREYTQQQIQFEDPVRKAGLQFEPFGHSKYDEGMPYNQAMAPGGIQDWRAEQQSNWAKWGNVSANFGTVATTSFINNTLGGIWGLGEALITWDGDRIANNWIANLTQDMQESVAEAMPLYRSQAEMELPWYQRLGTANWWGDVVISQGFTMGVIAAMAVTGGMIGLAQRGMQGYRLSKGAFSLADQGRFSRTVAQFGREGFQPQQATQAILRAGETSRRADAWRTGLSSFYSSHGYATTEAISHTRMFEEELRYKVEEEWNRNLQATTADIYERITRESPMISDEELHRRADEEVEREYNNMQEEIEKAVNTKRNTNYLLNLMYLTATNAMAWGSFAKGNYPTMKSIQSNLVKLRPGSIAVDPKTMSPFQKIKYAGGKIFKNPMIQFAEETALHINRESTADFTRLQFDPEASEAQHSMVDAYMERFFKTMGDVDEWESGVRGFIGGLLGGIGPRVQAGKLAAPYVQARGGIWETINVIPHLQNVNAVATKHADGINKILEDENLQKMYLHHVRSTVLNKGKDQALFLDDKFDFANKEASEFLSLMFLFEELGIGDQFLEHIGVAENIKAQEIRDAIITKNEDGTKTDPLSNFEDSEIESQARDVARKMREMYKVVRDNKNDIESLVAHRGLSGVLGQAYRDELLYYLGSLENMAGRKDEVISNLNNIDSKFTELILEEIEATEAYMNNKSEAAKNRYYKARVDVRKHWKELIDKSDKELLLDNDYQELVGVGLRIAHFKDLYETLMTEEGAKTFADKLEETRQESVEKNAQLVSVEDQKVEVPEVFKEAIDNTTFSETYEAGETSRTKSYKGLIEIDMAYKTKKDKKFISTKVVAEVVGIDEKGNLDVRYGEDRTQIKLTPDGRIVGVFSKDGEVFNKDLDGIWTDYTVVQTGLESRNEARFLDFSMAIHDVYFQESTSLDKLRTEYKAADTQLREINKLVKTLKETGETKAKIAITDENRQLIKEELGKKWGNNVKTAALTIKELQQVAKLFRSVKKTAQSAYDRFQTIAGRYQEEFLQGEFKENSELLTQEMAALEDIISKTDQAIEEVSTKISNLRTWINRLDKRKNKLQQALDYLTNSKEYKHREYVLEYGTDAEKAESLEIVKEALRGLDLKADIDGIEANIENARTKIAGLEARLEELIRDAATNTPMADELKSMIEQREEISKKFNSSVLGVIKKAEAKKVSQEAAKDSKKSVTTPIKESVGEEAAVHKAPITEEGTPPLHPFTDSPADHLVTINKQHEWRKEENAQKFEPQLAFQEFIDSYDINSGTHVLRPMNAVNILAEYSEYLTQEQRENLRTDEARKAAFVVIFSKEGNPELITSKFDENQQLIMIAALPEGTTDSAGKWRNVRESGHPILGYETYIRENLSRDPFKSVAEGVRKNLKTSDKGKIAAEVLKSPEIVGLLAEKFHNSFEVYENDIRQKIVKGESLEDFAITGKTSGIINSDNIGKESISAAEAFGDISEIDVKIGKGTVVNVGGVSTVLDYGIVKLVYKDRMVPVERQTLTDKDKPVIIDLLKQALETDSVMESGNIIRKINSVIYIQDKAPDSRDLNEYTLFVREDNSGVRYRGKDFISKTDLSNPESEAYINFVEFLGSKYYNVSQEALENSNNGFFSVTEDKQWDSYEDYLMSTEGNRVPRLKVKLPKRTGSTTDNYENPLFINRAFSYKAPFTTPKKVENPVTKQKTASTKTEEGGLPMEQYGGIVSQDFMREMVGEEEWIAHMEVADSDKKAPTTPDQTPTPQEKSDVGADFYGDSTTAQATPVAESKEGVNSEDEAADLTGDLFKAEMGTPVGDTTRETSTLDAFKQVFPDTEIHIAPDLDTEAAMTYARNKGINVYLRPVAVSKAEWHEGFHIVEKLFTSPEEIKAVYDFERGRIRNRIVTVDNKEVVGKDMTDSQISEFLAEEFRNYMLVGKKNYKWGKAHGIKQTWFEKIWDSIKKLLSYFHFSRSPKFAEKFFSRIEEGRFLTRDIVNHNPVRANRVGDFTSDESTALVGYIDYLFSNVINTNEEFKGRSFESLDNNEDLKSIYQEVVRTAFREKDSANILERLFSNKDYIPSLIREHTKRRRRLGSVVKLTSTFIDNNLAEVDIPSQFRENMTINVKDHVSSEVKNLISGLPRLNRKGELVTMHGLPSTVEFATALGHLHKHLEGIASYEEMVNTLSHLSDKFPHYRVLLDRLGSKPGEYWTNNTRRMVNLRTAFFRQFFKSEVEFLIGIMKEKSMYFLDGTAEASERFLVDEWKGRAAAGNIPTSVVPNKNFYTEEQGKLKVNSGARIIIGGRHTGLQEILKTAADNKSFTLTKFTKATTREEQQQTHRDFLSLFGIHIPLDYTNLEYTQQMTNFIIKNIPDIIKKQKALYLDDIYHREGAKINKEIKALAKELSYLGEVFVGNQYIDGKGVTNYNLGEKTRIDRVIDSLSDPNDIPADLHPFNGVDGNINTIGSQWVKLSLQGNGPAKAILKAFGEERSDKIDLDDLKHPDFISTSFNAVLQGINPYIRAADRTVERAFNLGLESVDFDIWSNKAKRDQIFTDYLKSEIVSAIAYRSDTALKHVTTHKNMQGLGIFEDIFKSNGKNPISDSIVKATKERVRPSKYLEVAESIIKKHSKAISNGLDAFFLRERAVTKKALLDNKVVEEYEVDGKKFYNLYSVGDEGLLRKFPGLKMDQIISNDFDKILDIFNFTDISGRIEQTKLITGHPLHYKKGQRSDLIKRATTFASTHTPSIASEGFSDALNELSPRIDGTSHTKHVKKIVRDETIVKSKLIPVLEKLKFTKGEIGVYARMSEDDGSSKFTLDGYESYARRNDALSLDQEKTLQYHKQWFYRDMINENIHPEFFTEEKFRKIFKKHLPKNFDPTKMYFEGGEIDSFNLAPVEPKKPVGQGIIQNAELVKYGIPSVNKLAAFYSNPMDLKGKAGYAELISATVAGVDIIMAKTAVKGPALGNSEGQLASTYDEEGNIQPIDRLVNEDGYLVEYLNWEDFGDQLPIDAEGHERATYSVQMRRMAAIDAMVKGVSRDGMEKYAPQIEEFHTLHRTKVEMEFANILEKLGIERYKATNRDQYKLTQDRKFLETLLQELDRRDVPDNVAESINIVVKQTEKYFDTLPTKRQIINLLQGLIRNNVIKTKFSGDMLVQEPSTGYESVIDSEGKTISGRMREDGVLVSNHLNPPTLVTREDGTQYVTPGEMMLPLPRKLVPFLQKFYPSATLHESLRKFNRAYKEGRHEDIREIFTIVMNRTPFQHLNSMEVMQVMEFTSPEGGPKAIVYSEIVAKSGSDYDIDKLIAYFTNFRIGRDGKFIKAPYLTEKESTLRDRAKAIYYSNRDLARLMDPNTHKHYAAEVNRVKQEIAKLSELKTAARYFDDGVKALFSREREIEAELATAAENKDWQRVAALNIDRAEVILMQRRRLSVLIEGLENLHEEKEEVLKEIEEIIKDLPIDKQNTVEAIENRINDIAKTLALAPENYRTLMTPNSPHLITDLAKKYGEKQAEFYTSKLVTPGYNWAITKSQWASDKLIGITAVSNTNHSLTQIHKVDIPREYFEVFFESFRDNKSPYTLGYYKDQKGNIISLTIGNAFLSAVVDAGNYEVPPTDMINYTTSTANTYMLLNRAGNDKTDPTSIDEVAKFMTRPVILATENALRINEAQIRSNAGFSSEKVEVIREVLKRPEFGIKEDLSERKFLFEYMEEVLRAENREDEVRAKAALASKLDQFRSKKSNYLNSDTMDSNPLLVAEYFLFYQEAAKLLREFQEHTRQDSSLAKNRESIAIGRETLERFKRLSLYNIQDLEKIYSDSFVGAFKNAQDDSYNAFSQFDLIQDIPRVRNFIWGEHGLLAPHLNSALSKPKDKIAEAAIKLQNATITYLLHTTPFNERGDTLVNTDAYYKSLMTGDKSFARKLDKLKNDEKYEDLHNVFISHIVPVIKEFISRRGRNAHTDYIKFPNKKFTTDESNALTRGIEDLFNSGDPELVKFAQELVIFSMIMSGVQVSPFSFFEVIPGSPYHTVLSKFISRFKQEEAILDYNARRAVLDNLRYDRNVVPRLKTVRKGTKDSYFYVSRNNRNSAFDYMSVEVRDAQDNYEVYLIEKYQSIVEENPATGRPEVVAYKYRRLPQRSDQYRVFSAKPMNTPAPRPDLKTYTRVERPSATEKQAPTQPTSAPNVERTDRIITRGEVKKNSTTLYLFGDNDIRRGMGGQAREMRGEPNTVGISTKKLPSNVEKAFKTDKDLIYNKKIITEDIEKAIAAWKTGKYNKLVIPPMGTGLAKLPQKAPETWKFLQEELNRLEEVVRETTPTTPQTDQIASEVEKIVTRPGYIKESAKKHLRKELFKIKQATQFIGTGQGNDSTTQRMEDAYKQVGAANTGNYSSNDLIYVSSNGRRTNRVSPVVDGELNSVYSNIDRAIQAGARFIMDTKAHLDKTVSYNLGEVALANYLASKGYVRNDSTGIWSPTTPITSQTGQSIEYRNNALTREALIKLEEIDEALERQIRAEFTKQLNAGRYPKADGDGGRKSFEKFLKDHPEFTRMKRAQTAITRLMGTRMMDMSNIPEGVIQQVVNEFRSEMEQFGILNLLRRSTPEALQLTTTPLTDSQRQEDAHLTKALKDIWNRMGISAEAAREITYKGEPVTAVAKANVFDKAIKYIEGKRGLDTLPEETGHILFSMMPENNVLRKSLYKDIVNTEYYTETVREYNKVYEGDQYKLRVEAIGKAIADAMIKENRLRMDKSVWGRFLTAVRGIMNWFKNKLNLGNPYNRVAIRVFNKRFSDFTKRDISSESPEFLQYRREDALRVQDDVNQAKWEQERLRKEREQQLSRDEESLIRLRTSLEVDTFDADRTQLTQSEADMEASTERVIEANREELKKVGPGTQLSLDLDAATKEQIIQDQLDNFETLYSTVSEMVTTESERRVFINQVMEGRLPLIC